MDEIKTFDNDEAYDEYRSEHPDSYVANVPVGDFATMDIYIHPADCSHLKQRTHGSKTANMQRKHACANLDILQAFIEGRYPSNETKICGFC